MKLSWVTLARGDDHGYAVVSRELCLAVEKAGATFLEPWTFGADLTVVFALYPDDTEGAASAGIAAPATRAGTANRPATWQP